MENKNPKKKEIYSEILWPIAVLTVICLVVSLCLSLTNMLTKDKIALRSAKQQNDAMAQLISADTYTEIDLAQFGISGDCKIFKAENGKDTVGYIITSSAKGYGGDVTVMTAADITNKITGVSILSVADETPGLGQNAAKPEFYSQFTGLHSDITLVKNSAKAENNEVNAVTGATITSRAVTSAINTALKTLDEYMLKAFPDTAKEAQ